MKTINILSIIVFYLILSINVNGQIGYDNNTLTGNNSSAIGENNTVEGDDSFVGGINSSVTGWYSFAFGNGAQALSHHSIALGGMTKANGNSSIAIGKFNEAYNQNSIVLGIGVNQTSILKNSTDFSLIVGFNSDKPTFFVGQSNGAGTTGKIGIGDVTDPQAKLHIKGDADNGGNPENADILLEPGSSMKYARIKFGTTGNTIEARGSQDLNFYTASDFVFWDANVGIGNFNPTEKLDVSGTIKSTGLKLIDGTQAAGKILQSDADGNASWTDPMALNVDDGDWEFESGTNNIFRSSGNVGIGTNSPDYDLHIASDIGSVDHTFLRISNENYSAGGSFSIGKEEGNGPVLIQRSGNIAFVDTLGNITGYPRVSILQKSKNGQTGMMLSTYTGPSGDVNYVDLQAPESDMYIRTLNNLIFRTGENKTERMRITQSGNVGIGKIPSSAYKLDVAGDVNISGQLNVKKISKLTVDNLTVTKKIEAAEIEVKKIPEWKDCVFDENYNLRTLKDVEQYIKQYGHLPDIPGESEVLQDGINLAEMNALLLQKIEELTLYVIELEKKIENEK